MFIQIYQMVLTTLMFIFSLISFSFMIASITKYLKNKSKKDKTIELENVKKEMTYIKSQLSAATDQADIEKLTNDLIKAQIKKTELEN